MFSAHYDWTIMNLNGTNTLTGVDVFSYDSVTEIPYYEGTSDENGEVTLCSVKSNISFI